MVCLHDISCQNKAVNVDLLDQNVIHVLLYWFQTGLDLKMLRLVLHN